MGKTCFPGFYLSHFEFRFAFVVVLNLFTFSCLALAFRRFNCKHCLQNLGQMVCSVTLNQYRKKILLVDLLCLQPLLKLVTSVQIRANLNQRNEKKAASIILIPQNLTTNVEFLIYIHFRLLRLTSS